MTNSCEQCGAGLAVATGTATTRCPACRHGLTATRHEHSVLFSLATLASVSGPDVPAPRPGTTTPRAVTPQRPRGDEGSGLIDIRAMQAVLGDCTRAAPPRLRGPAMPVSATPSPVHVAPSAASSQMPLYGLLVALMFGLASLTAFVLSEPPPSPPPSPRHTIPAPVVAAATLPEPAPEIAEPAPEEPVAGAPEPDAEVKTPARRPKPRNPKPNPPLAEKPPVSAAPASKPAASDDETMKCLLGSGACKVERPTTSPAPTPAPAGSSLPERLSDTDITAGTGPAKARATTSCARLAKGGERVKIKLSIAGPTGTVISARAEDDGGNPTLASCAAAELEKASFKPVQRPQMGALVTLKF